MWCIKKSNGSRQKELFNPSTLLLMIPFFLMILPLANKIALISGDAVRFINFADWVDFGKPKPPLLDVTLESFPILFHTIPASCWTPLWSIENCDQQQQADRISACSYCMPLVATIRS